MSRSACSAWPATARSSIRFPRGSPGTSSSTSFLRLHAKGRTEAEQLTWKALERVGMVGGRAPADRGLQQGHAPAHQAGPGHLPSAPGAGAGRAAQRAGPHGAGRDHRAVPRAGERGHARDHLQPHPARGGPHLRPGDSAEPTATWWPKARSRRCAARCSEHPLQVLVRCSNPGLLAARALRAGPRGGGQDAQATGRACW